MEWVARNRHGMAKQCKASKAPQSSTAKQGKAELHPRATEKWPNSCQLPTCANVQTTARHLQVRTTLRLHSVVLHGPISSTVHALDHSAWALNLYPRPLSPQQGWLLVLALAGIQSSRQSCQILRYRAKELTV